MGEFLTGSTAKTRSLRRTNEFLDVDRIDRQLQVAILIDGTESMEAELQSLQNNLRSFVRGLQNRSLIHIYPFRRPHRFTSRASPYH